MKRIPLLLALWIAAAGVSRAAIVVSGSVTTPGALCTITITSDLNFVLTKPIPDGSQAICIAFDNWVVNVHDQDFQALTPNVSVIVNGTQKTYDGFFSDESGGQIGDLDRRDGFIFVQLITAPAGATVTIPAASYSFIGISSMNPAVVQTFNGNIFLTDGNGHTLSNVIPEPSSAAMGGLGVLALAARRRSRR